MEKGREKIRVHGVEVVWRNATKRAVEVQCDEAANCWNERSRGYIGSDEWRQQRARREALGGGGDAGQAGERCG